MEELIDWACALKETGKPKLNRFSSLECLVQRCLHEPRKSPNYRGALLMVSATGSILLQTSFNVHMFYILRIRVIVCLWVANDSMRMDQLVKICHPLLLISNIGNIQLVGEPGQITQPPTSVDILFDSWSLIKLAEGLMKTACRQVTGPIRMLARDRPS